MAVLRVSRKLTMSKKTLNAEKLETVGAGVVAAKDGADKAVEEVVPGSVVSDCYVDAERPLTGRSVFAVRLVGDGVSVETGFLVEDGQVLRMPAVFPNRGYALEQVNDLIALIHRYFDELEGRPQGIVLTPQ